MEVALESEGEETMKTEQEILQWAEMKKKNLDRQLVLFMEGLHKDLKELEEEVKKKMEKVGFVQSVKQT